MRVPLDQVYNYLLGGRAHATFHNTATGNQLHIYIKMKHTGVWWVYYNKEYLGFIRGDIFCPADDFSQLSTAAMIAAQRFQWVWRRLIANELPESIHVLHDGTCGRCGRTLTDALSIESGLGPECRKKLGIKLSPQQQLELV